MLPFDKWFSLRFKKLLLIFSLTAFIPGALYFAFSNISFQKERELQITQLSQILQTAIIQNNRMIMEIFLKRSMDDLKAERAVLYFNGQPYLEFNSPTYNKLFLYTIERKPVLGMPKYEIELKLPYLSSIEIIIIPIVTTFLLAILLFLFFLKLKSEILVNVLEPFRLFFKNHNYTDEQETKIAEINDLLAYYKMQLLENEKHNKLKEQLSKSEAIARTTQMLAHDVRKPFTILKGIIGILGDAKNSEEFKSKLPIMLDEVQRSITSVDGLLKDVLEIGRSNNILPEPTSLQTLFEIFLNDLAKVYTNCEIEVKAEFKSLVYTNIETNKVLRVFLNIAGNAIEAMKGKGTLWFKTELFMYEDRSFVEFRIGNNGPTIPKEVMPKLFESFYTRDKKGGTGLGLAIAKKIVEAHGGIIRCESDSKTGTEFIFTLPALEKQLSENFTLHKTLREYLKVPKNVSSIDDRESRFEREILGKIRDTEAKIKVLLVDDEAIYRQTLVKLLTLNSDIASHLEIFHAGNSTEAYEKLENFQIDIVILDIDLGKNSENGIDIAEALNKNKFAGRICIHSNRFLSSGHVANLKVDMITRKPMDRSDLLELIFSVVEKIAPTPRDFVKKAFNIAVIEDSEAIMYSIRKQLNPYAEIHHFLTPENFLDNFKNLTLDMVITDQHFDPLSQQKGIDLAKKIKIDLCYSGPIVLASLELFSELPEGIIDKSINKQNFSWNDISNLLSEEKWELTSKNHPILANEMIPIPEDWNYRSPLQNSCFDFGRHRVPHENLTEENRGLMRKLVHDLNSSIGRFSLYAEQALKYVTNQEVEKLEIFRRFIEERFEEIKPFVENNSFDLFTTNILEFINSPQLKNLPILQEAVNEMLFVVGKDSYYKLSANNQLKNTSTVQLVQKSANKEVTVIIDENDFRDAFLGVLKKNEFSFLIGSDSTLELTILLISDNFGLMEKAQEKQIPAVFASSFDDPENLLKQVLNKLDFIQNMGAKNG